MLKKKVAEEDIKVARSERRPQVTYTLEAGVITDSLRPTRIGNSTGIRATVGVNVPLFDWGISKSRQTQAELQSKIAESSRLFAERQFIADFNSNLTTAKTSASTNSGIGNEFAECRKGFECGDRKIQSGRNANSRSYRIAKFDCHATARTFAGDLRLSNRKGTSAASYGKVKR